MDKKTHQLPVHPPAVFRGKVIGHFKMTQGNHRLNIILQKLVKQIIIEFQPLFIRLCFIALREDTAPGNRRAEALEAQLMKKSNILLVRMIEIDPCMIGIPFSRYDSVGNPAGNAVRPGGKDIADTRSPSRLLPCAL